MEKLIIKSFENLWNGFDNWKTIKVPSEFYSKFSKQYPKTSRKNTLVQKDTHSSKKLPEITEKDLREYQIDVLNSWEQNNFNGIVEHATGSGKSWTGTFAIKRFFEKAHPKIRFYNIFLKLHPKSNFT